MALILDLETIFASIALILIGIIYCEYRVFTGPSNLKSISERRGAIKIHVVLGLR